MESPRDLAEMALEEEQEMHGETRAERDRLRAVVEAVRPYMTLLPVEVAGGIIGIEPIDYVEHERDRMRAALADISKVVMPDVGHGGNYGFVVTAAEAVVAERDRLRAAAFQVLAALEGTRPGSELFEFSVHPAIIELRAAGRERWDRIDASREVTDG